MEKGSKVLVAGGGGFIGGHLVSKLIRYGHSDIRVVDCKSLTDWHQLLPQVENICADLRDLSACRAAARDVRYVFNLAADMGGWRRNAGSIDSAGGAAKHSRPAVAVRSDNLLIEKISDFFRVHFRNKSPRAFSRYPHKNRINVAV
jgi:uncharacterized protein YbjT (DUF2867 family)